MAADTLVIYLEGQGDNNNNWETGENYSEHCPTYCKGIIMQSAAMCLNLWCSRNRRIQQNPSYFLNFLRQPGEDMPRIALRSIVKYTWRQSKFPS